MSRKYSAWASNQPLINHDLAMLRLNTVTGNEQDQLRHLERVEAIPHMYINVDAPPPMTRDDARAMRPTMISRQSSSYFAAPTMNLAPSNNTQTKIWPMEKSLKNSSSFESASPTSKRHHRHKHHHHRHRHHSDKHYHHHHSRKHRAKSAESIRNRQHQSVISPSKMIITNPQYIEQDQQQQQPMIVYREAPNGEGYTVDTNGLATVPYGLENETTFVDDQQAPMYVYRDQQPQSVMTDGLSQQMFYNPEQETTIGSQTIPLQSIENQLISHRVAPVNETQVGNYSSCVCCTPSPCRPRTTGYIQEIERIYLEDDCLPQCCILQQSDPFTCLPQQQSSQIVYCTDPNHQEYLCTSPAQQQQQQQQFVCLENTPTTMQPTLINQIPVFNPLSAQPSLQRATSMVIQQPQQLQFIQQPQQLQVLQQPQQLQVIQQPQPLQIIQSPQAQHGQFVQIAQGVAPQVIQGQSVLQTIQMPAQTIAGSLAQSLSRGDANPQILYQRPYDPVLVPIQNQQVAIAQPPLMALSQPSYAPSRIIPAATGGQPVGANMFRHALLRTVADRAGVPVGGPSMAGVQLMQPAASSANLLIAGGLQRSASLPIVPLTPGGLLIPFQPNQTPGMRIGPLPRAGGYPSTLRNFDDIRRQMQERRVQLLQNLERQNYNRVPSPPVLSTTARSLTAPYASGNLFPLSATSSGASPPYVRPTSTALPYSQPSFAGSTAYSPYRSLRP